MLIVVDGFQSEELAKGVANKFELRYLNPDQLKGKKYYIELSHDKALYVVSGYTYTHMVRRYLEGSSLYSCIQDYSDFPIPELSILVSNKKDKTEVKRNQMMLTLRQTLKFHSIILVDLTDINSTLLQITNLIESQVRTLCK